MARLCALWGILAFSVACKGRQDKPVDAGPAPTAVPVRTAVPAALGAVEAKATPKDRLAASVDNLPPSQEPVRSVEFDGFRAGFAERDVTPTQTLPLAGYGTYIFPFGSPRMNSAGTHDPLKAAAVSFASRAGRPAIIVGLDSVGLSEASAARIRKRVAHRFGHENFSLIVSASHSHSAPDTLGLWGQLPATGRNEDYMLFLEGAVAEAAVAAFDAMVPARMSAAKGFAPNSSSGLDGVRKDDAFAFLEVRDLQGAALGTLTQWSAHPTVLKEKNNAVSADFVGAYRLFLSERFEGVHVYLNGAIGNVYPADAGTVADPFAGGAKDADVGEGYSQAAAVGQELFKRVDSALLEATTLEAPEAIESCRVLVRIPLANDKFLQAVSSGVVEHAVAEGAAPSEVTLLKVGALRFVAFPFELFPSVGNEIRGIVSAEGAMVIPLGLANDWLGYAMSDLEMADGNLKYWRDLSPSPASAAILREAFTKAVNRTGCE